MNQKSKKNKEKRLEFLKKSVMASIKEAAMAYSKLAGNTYLIVYGDSFVEIAFLTNRFAHLTGVKLYTSAEKFYSNAVNNKLSTSEYGFGKYNPYNNVQKKPRELIKLTDWLSVNCKILKDICITTDKKYEIGLTNNVSSIIFAKNTDKQKNVINSWYVPCSLRVNDTCIEKAQTNTPISFIFVKQAKQKEYSILLAKQDCDVYLPESTQSLLCKELFEQFRFKGNGGGDDGDGQNGNCLSDGISSEASLSQKDENIISCDASEESKNVQDINTSYYDIEPAGCVEPHSRTEESNNRPAISNSCLTEIEDIDFD